MAELHPGDKSCLHSLQLMSGVRQTILEHRMFLPGDAVLVAVSGGPDSVALLNVLRLLAAEFSLCLGLVHLNHGLRSETADRDERFVRTLARQLALPCFVGRKDVRGYQRRFKLSLEDAARRVRYAFYDDVLRERGFDKVALGHQANDNAELVLMNFLRGSGLRGLAGIPAVRNGKIVRPLIRAGRLEIMRYLESEQIPFVTDESNRDPRFLRNRIRHRLIPELENEYNPALIAGLNRLAAIMRPEEEWIRTLIDSLFEDAVVERVPGRLTLSIRALRALPLAAQRRLIRRVLEELLGHLRRIAFRHVDAACDLLRGARAHAHLDWPHGIQVLRREEDADFFTIRRRMPTQRRFFSELPVSHRIADPRIAGRISPTDSRDRRHRRDRQTVAFRFSAGNADANLL